MKSVTDCNIKMDNQTRTHESLQLTECMIKKSDQTVKFFYFLSAAVNYKLFPGLSHLKIVLPQFQQTSPDKKYEGGI